MNTEFEYSGFKIAVGQHPETELPALFRDFAAVPSGSQCQVWINEQVDAGRDLKRYHAASDINKKLRGALFTQISAVNLLLDHLGSGKGVPVGKWNGV